MEISETKLEGCLIIEPRIFTDDRGYFFESFNQKSFETATGNRNNFVQDNQSLSTYGTVRGLHFQKGEYAQAKLVRVLQGLVFDVAVDLRKHSSTYGQWIGIELSSDNNRQFYIPRGFAHGFSVLSETAIFIYKCDNYYQKNAEGGIRFDDTLLHIDWQLPKDKMKLSEKDRTLPDFSTLPDLF